MAAVLFAVMAVISGLLWYVAVVGASEPRIAHLLPLVGVPLGVAVLLVLAWGLARRKPWAWPLTVSLLWWLVVTGALAAVGSLVGGALHLPLAAIAAALVLRLWPRGTARPPLRARDRRVAFVLVAAYVGSQLWPAAAAALLVPGNGPFVVASDALDLSITVDCDAPDAPIDPDHADRADVADRGRALATVRWHWRQTEPFPGGADGLVVRWQSDIDQGSDFEFIGEHIESPAWVWQGCSSPACALTEPEAVPWWRSREFEVDIDAAGQQDGEVRLTLLRTNDAARARTLQVEAAYAHRDLWLRRAAPVTCDLDPGA